MKSTALLLPLALVLLASSTGCKKTREQIIQEAEEKGREMTEEKAGIVKGVGDGLQGEGKKAGESVAKGATGVVKAGFQGAKQGIVELAPTISEQLTAAGVKIERASMPLAEEVPDAAKRKRSVKVYLILDKPFAGDITLIARDSGSKELGRTKMAVKEEATGKNFLFTFDDPLVALDLATSIELR
ncbi:hypothetical protein [Chondromyces apiculatus]|uniref:Lipoprotein n=1 Tax=Chondromyces apiculatus DSM 436 TaxID=1192034 RepID=A0A017T8W6_9BACT|nr:hypothetical protein [Chondromyces apiculatus]EYF05703.1 Hypothetical protein CAP_2993 [Chondromyces apiculatus DSM 436]